MFKTTVANSVPGNSHAGIWFVVAMIVIGLKFGASGAKGAKIYC